MAMSILRMGNISLKDIEIIKRTASIHEARPIIAMMHQNSRISKIINLRALDYDDLIKYRFGHIFTGQYREESLSEEIAGELRFLTNQILVESNAIQDFFKVRNSYECFFMSGEFEKAMNIVTKFEEEYGFSFWSIDCKASSLSFSDTNRMEKFCDEIIEKSNNLSVKTYINIARFRFQKDVTGLYFKAQFKNAFQEYNEKERDSNFKESFKKYLWINADIARGLDLIDIRYLLIISDYLTLFDKYILLEKVIGWLCSEAIYRESFLASCIKECALYLRENLDMPFWENVCILLGDLKDIKIEKEKVIINKGLEMFCNGKMEKCHDYCMKMLKEFPNSFSLINLLAKSGECSDDSLPYLELACFVRRLYIKAEKNNEFVGFLEFCNIYERIYSLFSFGNNLAVIIENETRPIMLQGKMSYVNALISLNFIPSKLAFFLSESNRKKFLDIYKKCVGELFFCDWQISVYSEATPQCLSNYNCDETSILLNEIKNISCSEIELKNKLNDNKMSRNMCLSFMLKQHFDMAVDCDNIQNAIEIYVKAFFESQWMVLKIDWNKINNKITRKLKRNLENSISYCIYAYVTRYELSRGENVSETVVSSCKKIIKNGNISIVNMDISGDELEKKKTLFFLSNICSYDVLRRVSIGKLLVQDVYEKRLQIIEKIIPYYSEQKELDMINNLNAERKEISSKLEYLDIAKCINKGKINTGWIVFSDEAKAAIITIYNMYYKMVLNDSISSYINAFSIVTKDYVQEINRILSITIRHGILEGELLRFLKKGKICIDAENLSVQDRMSIEIFYKKIYNVIDTLLKEYIICTYKFETEERLLLFVDDNVLIKSFNELPDSIGGPEEIEEIYKQILDAELEERLPKWGKGICGYIDEHMRNYLKELYDQCEGDIKTNVSKVIDLLGEEIEKLNEWFRITDNQDISYRLITLGDVLQQEWECVEISSKIDENFIVSGNIINFLYTIIRELIWNAEKHNGYKEDDLEAYVKINIIKSEEYIIFEVINNISDDYSAELIGENIAELKKTIQSIDGFDTQIFNRKDIHEGKSGYKKIVKLLKRNCAGRYQIEIPQVKNEFVVKIYLSLEVFN